MKRYIILLLLAVTHAARAQSLTWSTVGTLYGDNTEFFTPYRIGETILGGNVRTLLRMRPGERTELQVGMFADHRSGSNQFAQLLRPILAFRYETTTSTAILGTMFPTQRRGFLEPLEGTLLELTRPVEYGLEYDAHHRFWYARTFLNWQKLNTSAQREVFDYGGIAGIAPIRFVRLEGQLHGVHHGGQHYTGDDDPVANNMVRAIGVVVSDSTHVLGSAGVKLFRLHSHGTVEPGRMPPGAPFDGSGTYLRAGATPFGWVELFGIWWRGRDFVSNDGDNNYNSTGATVPYYRSDRKYLEVGAIRRARIEKGVTLDAELRLHQFDGGIRSISLLKSRWEYSYRLLVSVPFDVVLAD